MTINYSYIEEQLGVFTSLYSELEFDLDETKDKVESEKNLNTDTEREGELTNLSNSITNAIESLSKSFDKITAGEPLYLGWEEQVLAEGEDSLYAKCFEKIKDILQKFEQDIYQIQDIEDNNKDRLALERNNLLRLVALYDSLAKETSNALTSLDSLVSRVRTEEKIKQQNKVVAERNREVLQVQAAYNEILKARQQLIDEEEALNRENVERENKLAEEKSKFRELQESFHINKSKFEANIDKLDEHHKKRVELHKERRDKNLAQIKRLEKKAKKLKTLNLEAALHEVEKLQKEVNTKGK